MTEFKLGNHVRRIWEAGDEAVGQVVAIEDNPGLASSPLRICVQYSSGWKYWYGPNEIELVDTPLSDQLSETLREVYETHWKGDAANSSPVNVMLSTEPLTPFLSDADKAKVVEGARRFTVEQNRLIDELLEKGSPEYSEQEAKDYEFYESVCEVFDANRDLLLQKHKDYGSKNISQSPGGALNGLRVRMWDKLARINNLLDSGATPANEPLVDSFRDLANYSVIAQMILNETWPES